MMSLTMFYKYYNTNLFRKKDTTNILTLTSFIWLGTLYFLQIQSSDESLTNISIVDDYFII